MLIFFVDDLAGVVGDLGDLGDLGVDIAGVVGGECRQD